VTGTSTSRDEILRRIRNALGNPAASPSSPAADPATDAAALPRTYLTTHADRTPQQTTRLLAENLTDYRAHVHTTHPTRLPATIARLLAEHGTKKAVTPPGLPGEWLTEVTGVELVPATTHLTDHLTTRQLDSVDSVITGCALAIAETGTIVLDASPDQGNRSITLIPDHHICVIHTPRQVVESVPQAMPRLDPTRPLTWISGPSATSDIELDRVEGVHGPRTLDVILVTSA
jgi:L-lactate dehydrogenase complex protein LldG